jgi:hypothetical protein
VSYNLLAVLPDELGALTGLQVLKATHNRLPLLPPSLTALTALSQLHMAANGIKVGRGMWAGRGVTMSEGGQQTLPTVDGWLQQGG